MDSTNRLTLRDQIRNVVEPTIVAAGFRLLAIELPATKPEISSACTAMVPASVWMIAQRLVVRFHPYSMLKTPWKVHTVSRYRAPVSIVRCKPQKTLSDTRLSGKDSTHSWTGRRRYSGVLHGFEDGNIIIEVDGQTHHVPLDQLDWGHLVLDLEEFLVYKPQLKRPFNKKEHNHD